MADRWLEARLKIEKEAVVAGPLPPSRPADPLAAIFGADSDDIIPVAKTAQIHDDGDTEMEIPDPIAEFYQKNRKNEFHIPEIIVEPAAPVHADGVVIEKTDGGEFRFTYANGVLARTELFDETGKRKGLVEEPPAKDLIIKTELAAILGLRVEDQVEVEQEVGG